MRKSIFTAMALMLTIALCGPAFGQKGTVAEKEAESIQTDVLIEAFFAKRTGDLPEMLKIHQVRVLVVPGRSTYFLDDKGQPRGLDYELLKGWEKMLNKGRKKGEPPVTGSFIPVTLEELGDALLEGRGDIPGITLVTPGRAREFAYTTPIFDNIQEVLVTTKGGPTIMGQGFQESALNNDARSPYGDVGIMQMLPSTAEWLGVSNYNEPEGNIQAGAKYMGMLIKGYSKEPEVSEEDRYFFALASYNAGPGRVAKYRKRAPQLGYDPYRWFGNVERVALRSGNLETVMYVRHILNYTMAYKSAYDRALLREKLKPKQG